MTRLPTKDEILAWIADNPTEGSKRDIARAFGIKGADRIELKRILKELEADGQIERRRKTFRDPDQLPPVSVVQVGEPDSNGDLFAGPLDWRGEGRTPRVLLISRESDPALGAGDRILARLTLVKGEGYEYEGRLIRRIGTSPRRILGVFRKSAEGGRILPVDKGAEREWSIAPSAMQGAKDGELVEAEQEGPRDRLGLPRARVITRLGDPSRPKAVSLIAIHQYGLRDSFPDAALAEAAATAPAGPEGRTDLTGLQLVTIDPADARDRDDAVFAEADPDRKNAGGHILWVAIADVAHYVLPGSALDREAWARGNSVYFPDRVVPMLPDRLSGDLCSLHEGELRACIAARLRIDEGGNMIDRRFVRAIMKSRASFAYEEVQAAFDGRPTAKTEPFLDAVLRPLYAAYSALARARARRQPLDLDLPERRIELDDSGNVLSVAFKERLDAHRLIEEFMILANVAAAETLIDKRMPLLFRVHEEPAREKLDALRDTAEASGLTLAKGQVLKTSHLNRLLVEAKGRDEAELINLAVLRSMTQAYYSPENFGHFGLALKAYAHFTSPIRRYSDLVVHRALIAAYRWGTDGLSPDEVDRLQPTAEQVSLTERRAMEAERDTADRYLAAYLADRVGTEIGGRVSGIQRFGAFVRLDETGADGLIPIREIGHEYFHYDRDSQTLIGSETGMILTLGQRVTVRIAEAVAVTGGLMLELVEVENRPLPSGVRRAGKGPLRRRARKAARSKAMAKRKQARKRN